MWVFSPEKRIAFRHQASDILPEGMARTYARILEQQGRSVGPRLRMFPGAVPDAIVASAPFGSAGTIFVSQGLVSLLSEEELRAVLLACLQRAADRDLRLQSFCAELSASVLDLVPASWRESILAEKWASEDSGSRLNVRGAVVFLCLWPISKAIQGVGGKGIIRGAGQAWDTAMGKMGRYRRMGVRAGISQLSLLNHVGVS